MDDVTPLLLSLLAACCLKFEVLPHTSASLTLAKRGHARTKGVRGSLMAARGVRVRAPLIFFLTPGKEATNTGAKQRLDRRSFKRKGRARARRTLNPRSLYRVFSYVLLPPVFSPSSVVRLIRNQVWTPRALKSPPLSFFLVSTTYARIGLSSRASMKTSFIEPTDGFH